MGNIASPEQMPSKALGNRHLSRLVEVIFPVVTAAIFTAAALLFWVQPMFGKLVLPLLGGTPAVWAATLLFFQTALLAGYLYAHALGRYLPLKAQIAVHAGVLVLAAMMLPVGIPVGTEPPASEMPVFWLFGLFTLTIGAPYTAVAATSPLLQRWFSMSGHPAASNPYQLYVASNAGSLIGLLGYPLVIEPMAGAAFQTILWSAGFVFMMLLIGLSALGLQASSSKVTAREIDASPAITWFERFRWVALSFVPSSLLLGVTTHITTDIAAMPLLWAFPLALYLVTFIIAFADRPLIPRPILLKAEALSLAILAAMMWFDGSNAAGLTISLIAFFVVALARHSELVLVKPPVQKLTEFYLWMSAGGALGGIFNAIVAPMSFDRITEYPLTLVAAGFTRLLLVPAAERWKLNALDFALLAFAIVAAIAMRLSDTGAGSIPLPVVVVVITALAMAVYHFQDHAWRFALGLTAMLILLHGKHDSTTLTEVRSFFGAYRLYERPETGHLILSHGTTIHGAQSLAEQRPSPLTYYAAEGPLGQAIQALQPLRNSLRYGVVGMGAGASACFSRDTDLWTFYEIDPLVVRLARDHGAFRFLGACTPKARIVTGDARLSLAREADSAFDILILDAFSSDSIPTHLMTREALQLARTKLAPGGVILFNISNRYLRLEPVVANTARAAGLSGITQTFHVNAEQSARMVTSSQWIALSPHAEPLARIAETGNWRTLRPDKQATVWTDDYSSLLGVIAVR